ncbi:MAG TPA: hypothetical protein VII63_02240 [Caulobacteraceae bacterium]
MEVNPPSLSRSLAVVAAGIIAYTLGGCAGAYVAGDIGPHRQADRIGLAGARLGPTAAPTDFPLAQVSTPRISPQG